MAGPLTCAAAGVEGHGDQQGEVAAGADGDGGGPGLLHVHHGFDGEAVDPRLKLGENLFAVDVDGLVDAQFAGGFDKAAGGGEIAEDPALASGGLDREGGQAPIHVGAGVGQAEFLQFQAVGAKRARVDQVGTGREVGLLDRNQRLRMLKHPGFRTDAGRHAQPDQLGAGGSIQDNRLGRRQGGKLFSVHR